SQYYNKKKSVPKVPLLPSEVPAKRSCLSARSRHKKQEVDLLKRHQRTSFGFFLDEVRVKKKTGIQKTSVICVLDHWIPAFAGMTAGA
ncbi:MAG TPA: hypothetical protein PLC40_11540, partial [Candidatus Hydrogenedentes bacterium]|nr:hypothetical protein [Candidatus Hydrogenedentota bacterium]